MSLLFEVPVSCEFGDDGLVVVPGDGRFVPPVEVEPGAPIWPDVLLPGDEVVPVVPEVSALPEIGGVPTGPVAPVVPVVPGVPDVPDVPMVPDVPVVADVPAVPEVPPAVDDELEPSRGCAAVSVDDGRARFAPRPCALDRFDFLVTDDERELVSSLVLPAIAASSLPAELCDVESGRVAFEPSPVASEEVCAVDDVCAGACAAALVANASAKASAMNVIFICMLSCSPSSFRWGRSMCRATV